ncbi:MAG: hypothetical protein HYZ57_02015, partial [Acidobacteria bacterium]|nr:hypothetical protein [Acidobacteriota bacterium]
MKASALLAALLLALVPAWAEKAKESAPRAADETPAAPVTRAGLASAAARRNENVQVNRIDNEALKESNIRLGDNVTVVSLPLAETGYYAAEHGRPAAESAVLRANPAGAGWHGEIYEFHQNSVFNARTFFQVGPVKPSHQNNYGLRLAGDAPRLGMISGSFGQRKIRGMVNGNVLVPLAAERTALAADPALRSFVNSLLAKYPD